MPTTGQVQSSPGAAVRRFAKEVERSLGAGSSTNTAPAATTSRFMRTRTATSVTIPKPPPRKDPEYDPVVSPISSPEALLPSSLGKRKPSDGSQPYAPAKSSIKRVLRDAKKPKPVSPKKVGFVDPVLLEEDSDDPRYPPSPVKRPTRAAVSKAAAQAGKQAKKKSTRKPRVERVSENEYERRMQKKRKAAAAGSASVGRGTTRSGMRFK